MKCITKAQLARMMGVSATTLRRYLTVIQDRMPGYRSRQKILTPQQYKAFNEYYCVE